MLKVQSSQNILLRTFCYLFSEFFRQSKIVTNVLSVSVKYVNWSLKKCACTSLGYVKQLPPIAIHICICKSGNVLLMFGTQQFGSKTGQMCESLCITTPNSTLAISFCHWDKTIICVIWLFKRWIHVKFRLKTIIIFKIVIFTHWLCKLCPILNKTYWYHFTR